MRIDHTVRDPRTPLNTRYMLGFELRVPMDSDALIMEPFEQDAWAEQQLRERGFKPLTFTHMKPVWQGNTAPVAIEIMSYVYKKGV